MEQHFEKLTKGAHTEVFGVLASHSWFISVVDSSELCSVKPVQLNQSKHENYEKEGAFGAMMFFSITIPFPSFFLEFHAHSSL